MNVIIHTDGGARGNPGPAAVGVVAKDERGNVLFTIAQSIGNSTNNVAEYTAVVQALEKVRSLAKPHTITFYLDSVLVVNQLNGVFKVKDPTLRELLTRIRVLEQESNSTCTYRVVPREHNKEADALVNQALDLSLMSH